MLHHSLPWLKILRNAARTGDFLNRRRKLEAATCERLGWLLQWGKPNAPNAINHINHQVDFKLGMALLSLLFFHPHCYRRVCCFALLFTLEPQETLRSQIWCPKEEDIKDYLVERFLDLDISGFMKAIFPNKRNPRPMEQSSKTWSLAKQLWFSRAWTWQWWFDH